MVDLENEINKLISYKEDNNIITIEDIDKVCIKSLESHVLIYLRLWAIKTDEALKFTLILLIIKNIQ